MADTNDITGGAASKAPTAPEATSAPAPEAKNGTNPQEAFARRERQIRRMQEQLQQQKQQWEAQRKQYETDYVPKSRLKEDFWSVAEEAGLDYNTLTEQVLAQPNDPVAKAMMAKVRAMEAELQKSKQMQEEAKQQQYEAAKKQIANQVKILVDGDPEFETIKSLELYDDVVSRIESEFHETGTVRDYKEVAMEIENELVEDAIRFAQLPKVQSRLKPQSEQPQASGAPQAPKAGGANDLDALKAVVQAKKAAANKPMTTISQRMETTQQGKGSEKERRERAIAAFLGQHKG